MLVIHMQASAFHFTPIFRFFKKREGEKRLKKPLGDDVGSVEDVDDDEFEQLLGKSAEGNAECLYAEKHALR